MASEPLREYEIVRVRTRRAEAVDVDGLEGVVLGVSEHDDGTVTGYAVAVYERDRRCWFLHADELEPTGRVDRKEKFYDGTLAHVSRRGELLGVELPDEST